MDTVTLKNLIDVGQRFISKAFEQSPTSGNGFGYLVAVLVALVIYMAVTQYLDRRDAKRYRDAQDKKADDRWELERKERHAAEVKSERRLESERAAADRRWKEENEARIQARKDFADHIDRRFDIVDGQITQGFDETEREIGNLKGFDTALDKRIARLEWESSKGG